ncbi:MAG: gliding motility-associated C-terminal domain-containing protein [Flavobacterium sp.]|nr:MAG: gliding motility-associated C-terminal domain-containing protein [Flavobacterium sp.]
MLTAVPANGEPLPQDVIYSWTGPENFSASGNPINITGNPPGNYSVAATASGSCGSGAAIDVAGTSCGIPKGVSPNDDGANDTWNLSGLNVEHVKIFNRYGMLVYEKARDVDEWRGQDKNGNILPTATYYYLVKLASGESKTGWVFLL